MSLRYGQGGELLGYLLTFTLGGARVALAQHMYRNGNMAEIVGQAKLHDRYQVVDRTSAARDVAPRKTGGQHSPT
ncbi:MAG: hypothetical protein AB7E74_09265 [Pirellulales bacterium]